VRNEPSLQEKVFSLLRRGEAFCTVGLFPWRTSIRDDPSFLFRPFSSKEVSYNYLYVLLSSTTSTQARSFLPLRIHPLKYSRVHIPAKTADDSFSLSTTSSLERLPWVFFCLVLIPRRVFECLCADHMFGPFHTVSWGISSVFLVILACLLPN